MTEKSNDSKVRVTSRTYHGDDDFIRVRNLLVETYSKTPIGFNWEVRRWDGWRYYDKNPVWDSKKNKTIRLWETENGRLVGAVHQEGPGHAHIQIHPDYRYVEESMIAWAEQNIIVFSEDGRKQLCFFVHENDPYRIKLLKKTGYTTSGKNDVARRLCFENNLLPKPTLVEGYTMLTIDPEDVNDCRQIAELLNAAFNRNFHVAEEYYYFAKYALCYRNGLDQVAVTPDGTFAAYVGAPYDEINKCGIFEPVCTHPAHQRKGLARSLMLEALHRLKDIGASEVLVGTGEHLAANRLYESIGFTEVYKLSRWKKII